MPTSAVVTKAVVPAAGLGTRFLPATKAMPKEMLPVVDKPAIQYVVEEAVAAGLDDVLLITGRGKRLHRGPLRPRLRARGGARGQGRRPTGSSSSASPTELATMHYVRQGAPKGLGHAVLCAAEHVGHEPFAVLLGDDFIHPSDPLLQRMIEVREQYGGSVVALMEVEPDQVSLLRRAPRSSRPTRTTWSRSPTWSRSRAPDEAPSNWIIIGRYVCDPAVFERAASRPRPAAAARSSSPTRSRRWPRCRPADGGGVHGVLFRGRRFDTGNKLDYLRTLVQFACERPDLAAEFVPWLRKYLDDLRMTQTSRVPGAMDPCTSPRSSRRPGR